ncbi:outer membrane lipoprotein carrier protein LolA [Fibrobacter sp. UWB13]|uniref:LolA family protein n=1 Tax=Fibrobacter sp. UWB13 TaxID=1896204 RepID=UPI000A1CECC1|nr:outer membrane lipoprotein carrier protein LolA [Fibrobacter sp. UWB13]
MARSIFCRLNRMILLLVLALSMSLSMAAVFDHPVNATSKQELSSVLLQMTRHDVVTGDFKQTKSIKKLNRDFVSTGTFRISKTSGIVWKTQKPFPSELTVSDAGISERNVNGQVRVISSNDNPVFAQFSKTIQAVFSGNLSELETNFNIFCEKTSNGYTVGLVPREKAVQKVIANIVMDVSENLEKVVITDGEGSPVVYEFSNQKTSDKNSAEQPGAP